MATHKNLETTELLIVIGNVLRKHLPVGHSFIPVEILLKTFYYHCTKQELTIKKLLHTGIYSDMGNRYHFTRLIESDWLGVTTCETDGRIRLVVVTDKLTHQMDQIASELSSMYGQELLICLQGKEKSKAIDLS
jgi:hypothetical protein